jgi:hypothetical protein
LRILGTTREKVVEMGRAHSSRAYKILVELDIYGGIILKQILKKMA